MRSLRVPLLIAVMLFSGFVVKLFKTLEQPPIVSDFLNALTHVTGQIFPAVLQPEDFENQFCSPIPFASIVELKNLLS